MGRPRRKSVLTLDDAPAPQARVCEHPGCRLAGEHRAPKARDALAEYRWFCLDHVREYNAKWDYYRGMKPDEIEAHMRADSTWRRPSWPLGARGKPLPKDPLEAIRDRFGLFEDAGLGVRARQARARSEARDKLTPAERQALEVLDLQWPLTLQSVKSRYKELVKRHHPDANGGDRDAEERLKSINVAYTTLRTSPNLPPA